MPPMPRTRCPHSPLTFSVLLRRFAALLPHIWAVCCGTPARWRVHLTQVTAADAARGAACRFAPCLGRYSATPPFLDCIAVAATSYCSANCYGHTAGLQHRTSIPPSPPDHHRAIAENNMWRRQPAPPHLLPPPTPYLPLPSAARTIFWVTGQ